MSVTLILRKSKITKRGLIPIYLRVTIKRKSKFISTKYAVLPAHWDEKREQVRQMHPNADQINADLVLIKNSALTDVIKAKISGKSPEIKDINPDDTDYFDFAEDFKTEVQNKRNAATLENYRKHTLVLENYLPVKKLPINDINHDFLTAFEGHLHRLKLGNNYIHAIFKTLRTIINAAKNKKLIRDYPFYGYEFPKYTAPDKEPLSMEEIDRLEKYADDESKDSIYRTSAIYLLLGINTGLRVSDWYKFDPNKHIKKDMVLLRAKKNRQWVTMPVTNSFRRNLARMEKFPLNIEEQTINEKLRDFVRPGIKTDKKLTTHIGRHTFAVTLCADQGISCETCAELMGITVKTCLENYYRVTPEKILAETRRAWATL